MRVALEQYRLHPQIFLNVLKQGFAYYSGLQACEPPPDERPPGYACTYYFPMRPSDEYIDYPHFGPFTGMESYTSRLVGRETLSKLEAPFVAYTTTIFPPLYRAVILFSGLLTGVGLLFGLYQLAAGGEGGLTTQRGLPVLCCVTGAYLIYAVPMIVLVRPEFRYVSAGTLLLLMSGLLSLQMLLFDKRAPMVFRSMHNHPKSAPQLPPHDPT
jgi:hypothetical protein